MSRLNKKNVQVSLALYKKEIKEKKSLNKLEILSVNPRET